MRRFWVTLMVVGGLTVGVPAAAHASVIVYVCGGNLCHINPDGSGQAQLTNDGQPGTSNVYGAPSLSRDGSKLAFSFDFHVIVSDANAQNRGAPFATTALVPLMRPDGGQLAELEETFSNPAIQLCTYNLDGTGRQCPYGTPSAGWAPDDNLLISSSAGAPNFQRDICHVPVGGLSSSCTDVRANDPSNDLYDPAVSPDGSTLAVTVAQGIGGPVTGHIALYDYATGQFERSLTSGTADELPAWSPDGAQIAFQRGGSIDVIAANGQPGSEHQLVANGSQPTWGGPTSSPPSPPDTKISKTKIKSKAGKATFTFAAVAKAKATSGFQCSLAKKGKLASFRACSSPKAYRNLKNGRYTFEVRAFDVGGTDPTPAKKKFEIG